MAFFYGIQTIVFFMLLISLYIISRAVNGFGTRTEVFIIYFGVNKKKLA